MRGCMDGMHGWGCMDGCMDAEPNPHPLNQFFVNTKISSISCYALYSKIICLTPVGDCLGQPLKKFRTPDFARNAGDAFLIRNGRPQRGATILLMKNARPQGGRRFFQ